MERLPDAMQDVIGNINYIVYRALTDYRQAVTEPFRAFPNLYTTDCYACVTRASLSVFHLNCHSSFG